MQESIDIHCHIMPGVDDGAKDLETSLEMLRIAEQNNIRHIILTPHHKPMHHNVSYEHNLVYTRGLQEAASKAGIKVTLYPGNEVYYSDEAFSDLEEGRVRTLADSDYCLVEFHPTNPYKAIHNAVYQVQAAGFLPIIAHVERYNEVVSHPMYAEELVEMGGLLQINASSVMGKYGFGISHFTKKLLKKHLVHFVATDAHDTKSRAPKLLECRNLISRKYGEDYADRLFYHNPMRVIQNETIG